MYFYLQESESLNICRAFRVLVQASHSLDEIRFRFIKMDFLYLNYTADTCARHT